MSKAKDPKIARLEKRAEKAKEALRLAKACKSYGWKMPPTTREYNNHIKKLAKALPKETRQKVLDAFHKGGTSLKALGEACGLTIHEVLGVIQINKKTIKYTMFNKETV